MGIECFVFSLPCISAESIQSNPDLGAIGRPCDLAGALPQHLPRDWTMSTTRTSQAKWPMSASEPLCQDISAWLLCDHGPQEVVQSNIPFVATRCAQNMPQRHRTSLQRGADKCIVVPEDHHERHPHAYRKELLNTRHRDSFRTQHIVKSKDPRPCRAAAHCVLANVDPRDRRPCVWAHDRDVPRGDRLARGCIAHDVNVGEHRSVHEWAGTTAYRPSLLSSCMQCIG